MSPRLPEYSDRAARNHSLTFREVDRRELSANADAIEQMYDAQLTGVLVRHAFPDDLTHTAVQALTGDRLAESWSSPNQGMHGGEIRTIGEAATPTYTAMRGPDTGTYTGSARDHHEHTGAVFGGRSPTFLIAELLSTMFHRRPAAPPPLTADTTWLPYNFRALDPGMQIFAHHDNHYGLAIYESLPAEFDRTGLLSWFVTLQAPRSGGELVVYSLWGSDPNPPMLPSRFLDTEVLERDYIRREFSLNAGDMIVFDAGRHVHRVCPVEGDKPRLTLGGFLTLAKDRNRLAFWS